MNIRALTSRLSMYALLGMCQLHAAEEHLCPFEPVPAPIAQYTIVDLGETDLDAPLLSNTYKKLSLAPKINNAGVVIGNTSKGGFVAVPGQWMYSPQMDGITINFHAINNRGDLLVALQRGHDSVEWMRWPCENGCYGNRMHIHTIDPFTAKFYVTAFNDDNTVTAYGHGCDGPIRPLTWSPCDGLTRLGVKQELDIKGMARAVSNNGTVAGVFDSTVDQAPFVWNPACGLLVATQYKKYLDPTGWVEFADMIVAEDSTVYGTYRIKHLADTRVFRGHFYEKHQANGSYYLYNAYMWTPADGQIEMMDLQGMRLTAVNKNHVLTGSALNNAVLRSPGKTPVLLASLIEPDEVKDWNLLEITDINDLGQVVGYGWYEDKMHLFLANPL